MPGLIPTPTFIFWSIFAGFHWVFFLKQSHSHSKAAPEVADSRISCHKVVGSLPRARMLRASAFNKSSSWFGGDAARLAQSIPKNIPQCREHGCHGSPRSDSFPNVCRDPCKHCPDVFGFPPSFLSKLSTISHLHKPQTRPESHLGSHPNRAPRQLSLQVRGKGS